MNEVAQLYDIIKRYRVHWRHPEELGRVVKKIEKGRMRPQQARRWLRRIRPWVRQQELCFNPFGPAPDQETLGTFDLELGELIERPGVKVGLRVLADGPRHVIVTATTGAGKSNLLRGIIYGLHAINRNARGIHQHSDLGFQR